MSATPRFIADLHFGHKNICKFAGHMRGNTTTSEEHDEWLIDAYNSAVHKRDPVYILGDVAFNMEGLEKVKRLKGDKFLLLGNHDKYAHSVYESFGLKVIGFKKYRGFWLSHAPIHPVELRGCKNIHGHVHMNTLDDERYINVSVEAVNGKPISIEELL